MRGTNNQFGGGMPELWADQERVQIAGAFYDKTSGSRIWITVLYVSPQRARVGERERRGVGQGGGWDRERDSMTPLASCMKVQSAVWVAAPKTVLFVYPIYVWLWSKLGCALNRNALPK